MEVPLHHMKRTRLLQHIPKIKLQQQAVWFLYVVVIAFSAAVGLLTQLYHQIYNPQIQISAESETKRSIFREKDKTKRSKKESAQHSKSRNKSFVMTSVSAL